MNNKSINWKDPLYLLNSLTEEEKKISNTLCIITFSDLNIYLSPYVQNQELGRETNLRFLV